MAQDGMFVESYQPTWLDAMMCAPARIKIPKTRQQRFDLTHVVSRNTARPHYTAVKRSLSVLFPFFPLPIPLFTFLRSIFFSARVLFQIERKTFV